MKKDSRGHNDLRDPGDYGELLHQPKKTAQGFPCFLE